MPFFSAFTVTESNAWGSTTQTAMPSALPEIAAFIALIISGVFAVSDPVHWYVVLVIVPASSAP